MLFCKGDLLVARAITQTDHITSAQLVNDIKLVTSSAQLDTIIFHIRLTFRNENYEQIQVVQSCLHWRLGSEQPG